MKKTTKASAKPAKPKTKAKSPARKTTARKGTPAKKTTKAAATKKPKAAPRRRTKAAAPTTDIDNLGELPRSYGQEQIFVIAQEPRLLFCYWDYTLTDGLDVQVFLRHSRHDSSSLDGEVPVPSEANSWYLPVREADAAYRVELGFYDGDSWKKLTQSEIVLTPRDALAEAEEAVFTDMNFHSLFEQMVEKLREEMRDGETLADAISRLRKRSETSSDKLTPAQLSMLQVLLGTQFQSLSSGELARLTSPLGASLFSGGFAAAPTSWGAAPGGISSGFLAQFGLAGASWSSAAWSSALGSWSSGSLSSSWGAASSWGAQPFSRPPERGFFMHVNAEVIFYGGTHPDAKVTIDGQEIGLRPDGSFHYHFVFPDGAYEIPIVATSPDGQETRRAVLRFERATAREGDVGATAQPPMNRPMGATA